MTSKAGGEISFSPAMSEGHTAPTLKRASNELGLASSPLKKPTFASWTENGEKRKKRCVTA
jgi:hypothetical protein